MSGQVTRLRHRYWKPSIYVRLILPRKIVVDVHHVEPEDPFISSAFKFYQWAFPISVFTLTICAIECDSMWSVFKEDQAKLKELRQENSKLEDQNHNLRLKIIRLG